MSTRQSLTGAVSFLKGAKGAEVGEVVGATVSGGAVSFLKGAKGVEVGEAVGGGVDASVGDDVGALVGSGVGTIVGDWDIDGDDDGT